jgi:hypothetical protein
MMTFNGTRPNSKHSVSVRRTCKRCNLALAEAERKYTDRTRSACARLPLPSSFKSSKLEATRRLELQNPCRNGRREHCASFSTEFYTLHSPMIASTANPQQDFNSSRIGALLRLRGKRSASVHALRHVCGRPWVVAESPCIVYLSTCRTRSCNLISDFFFFCPFVAPIKQSKQHS